MKITLKNSLLFFAGFFIVLFMVAKLFGIIAFCSVLSFCVGYLLGDSWGFNRGKKSGRRETRIEIEEKFERERKNKQHKQYIDNLKK